MFKTRLLTRFGGFRYFGATHRICWKKGRSPSFCFFEIGHVSCVRNLLGLTVFTHGTRPPCEIREGMKSVPSCSVWWKRVFFLDANAFLALTLIVSLKPKTFRRFILKTHRELNVRFVESSELLLFFLVNIRAGFQDKSIEQIRCPPSAENWQNDSLAILHKCI